MFAEKKVFVLASMFFMVAQPVRAELPSNAEGIELPVPINSNDIVEVGERIAQENCQTAACQSFEVFAWVYTANKDDRGMHGTFVVTSEEQLEIERRAGREIDAHLAKHKTIWPDICRTVQAVVARAEFGERSYSGIASFYSGGIAAFGLDIARRLTSSKLDCLGAVDKLIPPGRYRTQERYYAHMYCVADRSRLCGRLKD